MKTYWVYIMSNKSTAVCWVHQQAALARIPAQKQTLSAEIWDGRSMRMGFALGRLCRAGTICIPASSRADKLLSPNTMLTQRPAVPRAETSTLHNHRYSFREARGIGSAALKNYQSRRLPTPKRRSVDCLAMQSNHRISHSVRRELEVPVPRSRSWQGKLKASTRSEVG